MLLTKHADYAIRLLFYLAREPGHKVSIATIADHYAISRNHLMKVSQNLARLGYIIGYRGKGGGIALARPARVINIGTLLEQIERNLQPGQDSTDAFLRACEEARAAYVEALRVYTLADLMDSSPSGNISLLDTGPCGPSRHARPTG